MSHWFKCYPGDFIGGLADLDTDEQAFYVQLVFRMYDAADAIYQDDRTIARWCKSNARKWNRVKDGLISKGKLTELPDGGLINERTLREMLKEIDRLPNAVSERLAKLSEMFGQSLPKVSRKFAQTSPETSTKTRPLKEARDQKLESGVVHAHAIDFRERCFEAAGLDPKISMAVAGLVSTVDLETLARDPKNPCDLELDIVPAIQQCAASLARRGQKLQSWRYCREAAIRNRDQRLAGAPAPVERPATSHGYRNGGKLSAFERLDQRLEAAAAGQESRFHDERDGGEGYVIDAEATRLAG